MDSGLTPSGNLGCLISHKFEFRLHSGNYPPCTSAVADAVLHSKAFCELNLQLLLPRPRVLSCPRRGVTTTGTLLSLLSLHSNILTTHLSNNSKP